MKIGITVNGVYTIDPDGGGSMLVYCDMLNNGGGWTVIQRRVDGSVDFYLKWSNYEDGFGKLSGNFWLGNKNIHRLTTSGNTVLRVDLDDGRGKTPYAQFGKFNVAGEVQKYKLSVGSYSGTARDALSEHKGMPFTTWDNDNSKGGTCGSGRKGGWWFKECGPSNLNGPYFSTGKSKAYIRWAKWKNDKPLKGSVMKIRPPK